jgi:hypothetical protein
MNRILKGSVVSNGYDPRVVGQVVGFKVVDHKRIPIVRYDGENILDYSPVQLASKKKVLAFRNL